MADEGGGVSFPEQFAAFAKFGDTKNTGANITLKNSDKWMKQAGVIGKGGTVTTTDTGISFSAVAKGKRNLTLGDYQLFLEHMAKAKKFDVEEIKAKMCRCGDPSTAGTTSAVKMGGVDRLTDTSKYTGSHKERFDETGKGKGMTGRKDIADTSGYVGGYKGAGTFEKK